MCGLRNTRNSSPRRRSMLAGWTCTSGSSSGSTTRSPFASRARMSLSERITARTSRGAGSALRPARQVPDGVELALVLGADAHQRVALGLDLRKLGVGGGEAGLHLAEHGVQALRHAGHLAVEELLVLAAEVLHQGRDVQLDLGRLAAVRGSVLVRDALGERLDEGRDVGAGRVVVGSAQGCTNQASRRSVTGRFPLSGKGLA